MNPFTFITTTINTKWLAHQQALIQKHFPESKRIIVNGKRGWPAVWYHWLDSCHAVETKWIVLVDEDFFLFDSEPLHHLAAIMEKGGYDVSGVSDGFHHYRQENPVAMNSFFLMIRTERLREVTKPLTFLQRLPWLKNPQRYFKIPFVREFDRSWYCDDYPHQKMGECAIRSKNYEPYYPFFWTLKRASFKFLYLFPFFDDQYKSTNPRIEESGQDIGLHMWYVRNWRDRKNDVHGLSNFERYQRVEQTILQQLN